jgi:hypothetical protein
MNKHKYNNVIDWSIGNNNLDLLQYLITSHYFNNKKDYTIALNQACTLGNLDIVKCLVDGGVDVNHRDYDYIKTPLMIACECDYRHIIHYLVEDCNANVNAKYCIIDHKSGIYVYKNVLSYAKNNEIKEYLIKHGAKVEHQCCIIQ